MEDNNKKGFSTLYAVIGIATLLVAIIGATFAYFSATATANNITGNVAESGGLSVVVSSVTYDDDGTTGDSIIPLNLITNQNAIYGDDGETITGYTDPDSQFEKAIANKCIDDLGNNVCEVYKIVVTNESATATVQIRGTLKLTGNTTNMYWKLIDATTNTETVSDAVTDEETGDVITPAVTREVLSTGTEQDYYVAVQQGNVGNLTIAKETTDDVNAGDAVNVSLAGASTTTYYVIVWLEEIGTAQEDVDASKGETVKSYSGVVTFDAVDANGNKSGVTATFLD